MLVFWGRLIFVALLFSVTGEVWAQRAVDSQLKAVKAILDTPDDHIDLAKIKLTIDRMIDPSINIPANMKIIDDMTVDLRSQIVAGSTSGQKLEVLKKYVYQTGPGNSGNPFRYDLADPFGRNIKNKLLPTYLKTHLGNCVSMPVLFIVLAQRIGLDVTAATAPEHIFVKYRDESGQTFNLETTSGAGFTRDVWITQQLAVTQRAIESGIYMRPLTKKETVVLIVDILNEHYGNIGDERARIALSKLEMQYAPKYVEPMLHISAANWKMRQQKFVSKYPTPNDIPMSERAEFLVIDRNISEWRAKAEALGWRMPN